MLYMDHIRKVMRKADFPEDAQDCFNGVLERIEKEDAFGREDTAILEKYLSGDSGITLTDALSEMYPLCEKCGENFLTMQMVFVLSCTPEMYARYRRENIDEALYWDAMADLKAKLTECRDVLHINGTFVGPWFDGWFRLERFALGRFQYDFQIHSGEAVTLPCGEVLTPGTPVAGMHIPSTGVPLTDEIRNDSYRKAYAFLSARFRTDKVFLCCESWLLYAAHYDFLPENSNILRFMNDFYLYRSYERNTFDDAWRVFSVPDNTPLEAYPENTSLRRAYKKWLVSGHKSGGGLGYILLQNGINTTHIH